MEKVNLLEASSTEAAHRGYFSVGGLNGQMLNVLSVEDRKLDFHIHEDSDEMFYVIEGEMDLEFDDGLQHLVTGELIIVPAGMRHRPMVTTPVKCLLIEQEGTLDESNTGGRYGT